MPGANGFDPNKPRIVRGVPIVGGVPVIQPERLPAEKRQEARDTVCVLAAAGKIDPVLGRHFLGLLRDVEQHERALLFEATVRERMIKAVMETVPSPRAPELDAAVSLAMKVPDGAEELVLEHERKRVVELLEAEMGRHDVRQDKLLARLITAVRGGS